MIASAVILLLKKPFFLLLDTFACHAVLEIGNLTLTSKNVLQGLLFNFSLYCLSSVNQTLVDWNQSLPLLTVEVEVKQISRSYLLGDSSVFSCKTKIAATKCVFFFLGFYVKTLTSFSCLTDRSSQMQHEYVSLLSFLQHTTGQSKKITHTKIMS